MSEDKALIWVAVQQDGREIISANPEGLQRFSPSNFRSGLKEEVNKVVSFKATRENCDIWIEYHDPDETDYTGEAPQWMYVPKGTIKRLIGRELTWEDEPVKIEDYEKQFHTMTREEILKKLQGIPVEDNGHLWPIKYFSVVTPTGSYINAFAAACSIYTNGVRNFASNEVVDKIFKFGEEYGGVVDFY